ncbi:MAG: hypothetical protein ACREDK_09215 [Thermoplasmata archaeon]
MRPVPPWVAQAVLPWHGEAFADYWGPLETTVDGHPRTGTLVLSNHRLFFVRVASRSVAETKVDFASPLNQLHRIVGEHDHYEGRLVVDRRTFSFRATTPQAAGDEVASIVVTITGARALRLEELHAPPPVVAPLPTVHREIVREIVKVPCRYCGSLVEVTSTKCAACGATLRLP